MVNEIIRYIEKIYKENKNLQSTSYKEFGFTLLETLIKLDKYNYNKEFNFEEIINKKLSEINTTTFNEDNFTFDNCFSTEAESYNNFTSNLPYSSAQTSDFSEFYVDKNELDEEIYQIAYNLCQYLLNVKTEEFVDAFVNNLMSENNSVDYFFYE